MAKTKAEKKSKKASASVSSRSSAGGPKQRQSSPALVVTLVISMLLAIVMGVLLYMDKDKLTQATAAEATAKDAEKKATEAYTKEMGYLKNKLKSCVEQAGSSPQDLNEIKEFESRQSPLPGSKLPDWFPTIQAKVEGNPAGRSEIEKTGLIGPYAKEAGKAQFTLEGKIEKLSNDLASSNEELKNTRDASNKQEAEYKAYKAQYNDGTIRSAEAKGREEAMKKSATEIEALKAVIAEYTKKYAGLEDHLKKKLEEERTRFEEIINQRKQDYDEKQRKLETDRKVMEETYKGRSIVHFDEPRGEVLEVRRGANIVVINIGSEKRVRPHLTFSVYGKGAGGKASPEPKAHIELVAVTGPNTSLARITQMARLPGARTRKDGKAAAPEDPEYWHSDPKAFWRNAEPILKGDLVYNPAWDPMHKVRVALAGVFDIDGDGRDDQETFIKLLADLGADVTAHIDKNLT